MKILFMTIGKVFTNANNENVGETVDKSELKQEADDEKETAVVQKELVYTNKTETEKEKEASERTEEIRETSQEKTEC